MVIHHLQVKGQDQKVLESIISQAKKTTTLLFNPILRVRSTFYQRIDFHLGNIKLVRVLVIICQSTYQNNSNYVPLIKALYLYSISIRVDAIILSIHFDLSLSYDILQKNLKNITSICKALIKQQSTNCKLVKIWDNFKYCKNVYGKKIRDIVKF